MPGQVRVDNCAPVFGRDRLDRAGDRDPRVVDHRVETACRSFARSRMTADSIDPSEVTSSSTACVPGGSSATSLTPAKTIQPSWARCSAAALPIPVDAPVTRTLFRPPVMPPPSLVKEAAPRRDALSALGSAVEALRDLVPVDDVPERVEVVGALVLVLQVVGVLPDVDAEERRLARPRRACPGSGWR